MNHECHIITSHTSLRKALREKHSPEIENSLDMLNEHTERETNHYCHVMYQRSFASHSVAVTSTSFQNPK